jgi:hypothetical protein
MSMKDRKNRQGGMSGRRSAGVSLTLAAALLGGCEGLLEVELPGQISEESLYSPDQAQILVSSAIGDVECAYSDFIATNGAGNDDVFLRVTGWWGGAHEYQTEPNTANCNVADNGYGWYKPFQKGRYVAEKAYNSISGWTDAEVAGRPRLLAQTAIYAGVVYGFLGEHFCEIAVDHGALMTPAQTLTRSEEWYTKALGHIGNADFALPAGISTSAAQTAYLLRARTRFAKGDLAGARADAEKITKGFKAYISREGGGERTRWNRIVNTHNNAGWNTIIGPIDGWKGPGNWPPVIPFTGYRDLGVLPDGRAISTAQNAITTATAGAVKDIRVPVLDAKTVLNRFPVWRQQKYTSLDSDMPLANWEEAWLIRAEIEGGQRAITLVNEIRASHGLPLVTYLSAGDAKGIKDMIIEERRRSLFLEGRFWATKIREDLWFPRGTGTTAYPYPYQQAVRMLMPESEFQLNPNLAPNQRGTLCGDERAAI